MTKLISSAALSIALVLATLVANAQTPTHGAVPALDGACKAVPMLQAGRVGETMLVCTSVARAARTRALPERTGHTVVIARLGR